MTPAISLRAVWQGAAPWLLGLASAGMATAASRALWPEDQHSTFALYYFAVIVCALYGPRLAAWLAMALSVLATNYLFLPPYGQFSLTLEAAYSAVLFCTASGLIVLIVQRRETAEARLRQSHELLHAIVEGTSDAVYAKDRAGRYLMLNSAASRIVGKAAAEALGKDDSALFPPEEAPRIMAADRRVMDIDAALTYEETVTTTAGTRTYLSTKGPLHDDAGRVSGIFGIARDIDERKQAEQALRESERRFRSYADAAPAVLWVTEPDGSCSFLSRGWCEITGQTGAEALGFGWIDAVHFEDRGRAKTIFVEANHRREPFSLDYRLRQKNGEYRWAIDSGRPRFGADGDFLGYVGSVIDAHDRMLGEQALRESERRFSTLIGNLPGAAYRCRNDPGYAMEFVSDGVAAITGHPARDFLEQRRSVGDFVHPADRDRVWEETSAAVAAGRPYEMIYRMVDAAGTEKWVWEKGGGVPNAAGEVEAIEGFVIDITARMHAERDLRMSHERLAFLAQATPAVIYTARCDGDFAATSITDNVARATGYAPRQFTEDPLFWASHVHPDDLPVVFAQFEGLTTTGHLLAEYRFRVADGSHRWFQDAAQLVPGEQGTPAEIVGSFLDVTERKEAEQTRQALLRRVTSAQEDERRHIARALHDDIGQALTAVRLNLQTMRRARADAPRARALTDSFGVVDEATERVRSMSLDLHPKILEDLGLVAALEWYCGLQTKRSGIPVTLNATTGARYITYSPAAFACYRIAQEAVTNALRHARARHILVALVRRHGNLVLEVADDGAGFNPAAKRVAKALGLAGMRERAVVAGGRLAIESRRGAGTRVRAEFTLETEQ